jgi:hypothetical protein
MHRFQATHLQPAPTRFVIRNALLCVAIALSLPACGNQHSSQVPITVTFSAGFLPPTSAFVSEQCGIAATIANDPKFAGVTWACTPASQCGTFNPSSTPSTVPTTYTSPSSIPAGNNVSITAISVSDTTKSAAAQVQITLNTDSGCVQPQ